MAIPVVTLRTGAAFPALGLGMWKVAGERVPSLIAEAVDAGYRHFDCACDYGNEQQVGEGLRHVIGQAGCSRDDLWITSKLWNTYHRGAHVRMAAERSLRDLQLDYLDLYLIHFPIAQQFVPFEHRYPPGWFYEPAAGEPRMQADRVPLSETWGALEQLVEAGLVRNIGVCNFGCSLLRDLLAYAQIPPAVLQVESHPYLVQDKLLRFCQEQEIVYTAFSPLGALSYYELGMADATESVLSEPVIRELAARYQKTPAQIALRWGIQRRTVVIPKTSQRERLHENAAIFDFALTDEEMKAIGQLDRQRRYNDPGVFCEAAFNTFFPIYE
jgi:D-xylose reductase